MGWGGDKKEMGVRRTNTRRKGQRVLKQLCMQMLGHQAVAVKTEQHLVYAREAGEIERERKKGRTVNGEEGETREHNVFLKIQVKV